MKTSIESLWITDRHHCTVKGPKNDVKKFVKAFKKHQGIRITKDTSRELFEIRITKNLDSLSTSIDNGKFNVTSHGDDVRISSRLRKFFFKIEYQINFECSGITSIYVEPSNELFYHLFCLRIILPACSYELLNFGWLRLKASSFCVNQNVVLLPGFSGDGKTTRALQAMENGDSIFNDTFTFISNTGELSASYNTLQVFRRNFDIAKKMLLPYQKLIYTLKTFLSIFSFGSVNISHEIKYPKLHLLYESEMLIEIFPKYENIWVNFRLLCASDYNENKEFYNLLNIHPLGIKNSLLDIHIRKYKKILTSILSLNKVRII